MDYRVTHKQMEDRALLIEAIAALRVIGGQVYKQPNIEPDKRINLLDLLLDAEKLLRRWEGK